MSKLLLTVLFCFSTSAMSQVVTFIRDDVFETYQKFLNGKDVHSIDKFESQYAQRDVVDMVLVQQALKLGGVTYHFDFVPGKINFRNTNMLQQGKLLVGLDSYWLTDATKMQDSVYISAPIIRQGEYLAGIYASPSNHKVFALSSMKDFKKLSAVSTPKWHGDWQTLSALPLKELVREDTWVSQARMVHEQFVDFFMMPLNVAYDGQYKMLNIKLQQVPNIALMLDDSRHFVVSKKHPDGEQAFKALQKGLNILRQKGKIKRAFLEAGFFVDKDKYQILNKKKGR